MTAIIPTRIAPIITKAAPKLDIENLVATDEILGGGETAARVVEVAPAVVLEEGAALDAAEPEADPDAELTALSEVLDEVVCEDEEDVDVVVLEPAVEVTVELIVN